MTSHWKVEDKEHGKVHILDIRRVRVLLSRSFFLIPAFIRCHLKPDGWYRNSTNLSVCLGKGMINTDFCHISDVFS